MAGGAGLLSRDPAFLVVAKEEEPSGEIGFFRAGLRHIPFGGRTRRCEVRLIVPAGSRELTLAACTGNGRAAARTSSAPDAASRGLLLFIAQNRHLTTQGCHFSFLHPHRNFKICSLDITI
jgi:hypothetical protein